ncbi:M23 family metallopeptidase [Gayadomonas joobiniege]|uniref:M23 family metallopeptidase n=1 Tax=Gayadomonas joobiniege TaxID=1234606 RepID=UPI000381C8C6|nr:M23 family metallopeptidase [Gayadomonas joobiniege]
MRTLAISLVGVLFFAPKLCAQDYRVLAQNLTQGGFLKAQAKNCQSYKIKEVNAEKAQAGHCTQDGFFIAGFSRDAGPTAELTINYKNGELLSKSLPIKQREYQIDRIEGVPQKTVTPPESVLTRIRQENGQIYAARNHFSEQTFFLTDFIWPAKGRISGVYGSQRYFNGTPKRPHYGLDIAAPKGDPVVAPANGIVRLAHPDMYYSGGTMILDHGYGFTSTFIHLSKLTVKEGQMVKQGDKIAEIGASGRATGPHLDWRINWYNVRLDPAYWVVEGGHKN